jgi:hypothetical protein
MPVAVAGGSAVSALDLCGGAVQLGRDRSDGLSGGALGPVEDVNVASSMYSAEWPEDDVGVRPSGPTGHQREAAARGDGLGDHREFVDAVDDVESAVGDARDGLDDGHQRESRRAPLIHGRSATSLRRKPWERPFAVGQLHSRDARRSNMAA